MIEALKDLEQVLVREEDSTLVVTINRPDAMNALNAIVLRSLGSVIEWLTTQNTGAFKYKALVITGQGEKAFVAGADIKQFEGMRPDQAQELATRGQHLFTRLEELNVPVIAAVNGFALGGGLELALACDFIYASENAKFGLPECTLGLMPGFGGTVRLPRRIGPARAREMTFTGGMINAQEALAMGLANKVVPQADLMKTVFETAKAIAGRAPLAVGAIKRSIHNGMNLTEAEANGLEAELFGQLFKSQDVSEGVKAFIEKRKPSFQGK